MLPVLSITSLLWYGLTLPNPILSGLTILDLRCPLLWCLARCVFTAIVNSRWLTSIYDTGKRSATLGNIDHALRLQSLRRI